MNPLLSSAIAQSPEYMAACTAAYQAALMSQPSVLPTPGVNPQLAALQAAQAAALGAYAAPTAIPNLQQQVLAAAVQQQLAGMQAPYKLRQQPSSSSGGGGSSGGGSGGSHQCGADASGSSSAAGAAGPGAVKVTCLTEMMAAGLNTNSGPGKVARMAEKAGAVVLAAQRTRER